MFDLAPDTPKKVYTTPNGKEIAIKIGEGGLYEIVHSGIPIDPANSKWTNFGLACEAVERWIRDNTKPEKEVFETMAMKRRKEKETVFAESENN